MQIILDENEISTIEDIILSLEDRLVRLQTRFEESIEHSVMQCTSTIENLRTYTFPIQKEMQELKLIFKIK